MRALWTLANILLVRSSEPWVSWWRFRSRLKKVRFGFGSNLFTNLGTKFIIFLP